MKKPILISAFTALIASCGIAQVKDSTQINLLKEVVISDTKFVQTKEKSGKIISKITAQELEKKVGQNVAQLLNQVAGVEISGNQSTAGINLGYYIRGGKNNQVLILIDGVPITDASGITIEYDLRLLSINQIESIEIMKGASSTLYGTGAATAVINITLKKSTSQSFQANAYINLGSNNTSQNSKINGNEANQGFSFNGKTNIISYLTSFNSTEVNGMSQIAAPNDTVYENDKFSRQNILAKMGIKVTEKLTLDFFGNFDRFKNDYDFGFDNTGFNDTNKNKAKTILFRAGFLPKYKYNKGEFILNSSLSKTERFYNEWNSWGNNIENWNYQSRSINLDAFNKYNILKNLFFVVGTNYQFHDMATQTPYGDIEKESTKFNMLDGYITAVYTSGFGLNINAGGRLNNHNQYGNQWVYNINPSFIINKNHKIITSLSTAIVTPSLYQLYSQYGNLELSPEKNLTAEAGLESTIFNNKINISAVGFFRQQNNTIGFDTTYHYANVEGTHKVKGLETEIKYFISKHIQCNANYTFTQPDEALNRLISKHKININLDIEATAKWFFNASYQYVDTKNDSFFDGNTYAITENKLDSYQLVNFSTKYELIKNKLLFFGAITNILNEDFIEKTGYATRGRNFKIGININF